MPRQYELVFARQIRTMLQRGLLPRLALVAVGLACCCTAVPTATASGGDAATSTLFACGSTGEAGADSRQVLDLFAVVKTVCCEQLNEHCDDKSHSATPRDPGIAL
eukprot:COSAG06_NODE_16237_length_1011_cov_2.644737_2_plen_106_part_00